MHDIDTAVASGPVVLPGDAWELSPAEPEYRILGILTMSAGETEVWTHVDQQFLLDLRAVVDNRAADVPPIDRGDYTVSRLNGVLYVAVTDEETGVMIEGSPDDDTFLATVQTRLEARRAADARYYLTRAAIFLATVAGCAAIWIAAPHVIA